MTPWKNPSDPQSKLTRHPNQSSLIVTFAYTNNLKWIVTITLGKPLLPGISPLFIFLDQRLELLGLTLRLAGRSFVHVHQRLPLVLPDRLRQLQVPGLVHNLKDEK